MDNMNVATRVKAVTNDIAELYQYIMGNMESTTIADMRAFGYIAAVSKEYMDRLRKVALEPTKVKCECE